MKPKTPIKNNNRTIKAVATAPPIFPPILKRIFYEQALHIASNPNEGLGFIRILASRY
jgi:hypothetical protein